MSHAQISFTHTRFPYAIIPCRHFFFGYITSVWFYIRGVYVYIFVTHIHGAFCNRTMISLSKIYLTFFPLPRPAYVLNLYVCFCTRIGIHLTITFYLHNLNKNAFTTSNVRIFLFLSYFSNCVYFMYVCICFYYIFSFSPDTYYRHLYTL